MLPEFPDLAAGCSDAALAAFLHVSIRTIQNWRRGRGRAPYSACALVWLWLGGDLSKVYGKEWDGFSVRPDALFHPFWRHGFTPGELKAHFFYVQMVPALTRENEELRAEVARLAIARAASRAHGARSRAGGSSLPHLARKHIDPQPRPHGHKADGQQ